MMPTGKGASGLTPGHHFTSFSKLMPAGRGAELEALSYRLSRHACHLIAMNGDSSKPEIAAAQVGGGGSRGWGDRRRWNFTVAPGLTAGVSFLGSNIHKDWADRVSFLGMHFHADCPNWHIPQLGLNIPRPKRPNPCPISIRTFRPVGIVAIMATIQSSKTLAV